MTTALASKPADAGKDNENGVVCVEIDVDDGVVECPECRTEHVHTAGQHFRNTATVERTCFHCDAPFDVKRIYRG